MKCLNQLLKESALLSSFIWKYKTFERVQFCCESCIKENFKPHRLLSLFLLGKDTFRTGEIAEQHSGREYNASDFAETEKLKDQIETDRKKDSTKRIQSRTNVKQSFLFHVPTKVNFVLCVLHTREKGIYLQIVEGKSEFLRTIHTEIGFWIHLAPGVKEEVMRGEGTRSVLSTRW